MSDPKINSPGDTGLRVSIEQSRPRQTADTSFGHVMSEGLGRSADTVLQAGQIAAPFIPGGAVLSAAISGVGSLRSSVAGGQTAASSSALSGTGSGASSLGLDAKGAGASTPGVSSGDMIDKMQRFQEMNQSFNMQYLLLQQKMQDESRRFSVLSNVMKVKHDTVKNSIANVR